jgi:hypothetical protein
MPENIEQKRPVQEVVETPRESTEDLDQEKPVSKAPQVLSDKERVAEIARIDDRISSEQESLNAARQEFGLPPTDTSAAIDDLGATREKLTEKAGGDASTTEQTATPISGAEKNDSTESMRKPLSDASESVGRLANIFQRREERRMYPLLQGEDIRRIGMAVREINAISPSSEVDFEQITNALTSMHKGLEKFGTYRSQQINEDGESLGAISTFAKQAGTSMRDLQRALARGDAKGIEQAARQASNVAERLEYIATSAQGRRERADTYAGGRRW